MNVCVVVDSDQAVHELVRRAQVEQVKAVGEDDALEADGEIGVQLVHVVEVDVALDGRHAQLGDLELAKVEATHRLGRRLLFAPLPLFVRLFAAAATTAAAVVATAAYVGVTVGRGDFTTLTGVGVVRVAQRLQRLKVLRRGGDQLAARVRHLADSDELLLVQVEQGIGDERELAGHECVRIVALSCAFRCCCCFCWRGGGVRVVVLLLFRVLGCQQLVQYALVVIVVVIATAADLSSPHVCC